MRRLFWFFVLAFALSWYPWLIALARGATSGPNPLGPLVAALIVVGVTDRWRGVRELLARIVRWRVGFFPYAIALGLPILLCGLGVSITAVLATDPVKIAPVRWQDVIERFLFILLFIGLGEETGWRGFALPELQRRYSPLVSTLILAAIWTVWHLPLFGNEFQPAVIPAWTVSLLGASFVLTWLFNKTDSVLLPMVMHATVNTMSAFSPRDLQTYWWINAALWLAAGAVVALRRRDVRPAELDGLNGRLAA